jgi:ApaG protein
MGRSSAITEGLRVSVESRYLPEQSSPTKHRYVFAYTIRLENEGSVPAQLKSRHWLITDASGHIEEVRGPGVVGEQPVMQSGEKFEYTSHCVLQTPRGTMRGSYRMVRSNGTSFDAEVSEFTLALPETLN